MDAREECVRHAPHMDERLVQNHDGNNFGREKPGQCPIAHGRAVAHVLRELALLLEHDALRGEEFFQGCLVACEDIEILRACALHLAQAGREHDIGGLPVFQDLRQAGRVEAPRNENC